MVALNFDRARPEALLNLTRSPSCGAGRARTARCASAPASPTPRRCAGARRAAAGARGGVAHGRLAADPQPRHDRRQPRHRLAGRRRAAAAPRRGRRGRARERARRAARCRSREFLLGAKRNALADDELIARRPRRPERRAADVHEGRPAERDGDRRLLARARRRPRARRAPRVVRLGRRRCRHSSSRRSTTPTLSRARRRRREPDRRRPRHAPRTAATRCACSTRRALERCLA